MLFITSSGSLCAWAFGGSRLGPGTPGWLPRLRLSRDGAEERGPRRGWGLFPCVKWGDAGPQGGGLPSHQLPRPRLALSTCRHLKEGRLASLPPHQTPNPFSRSLVSGAGFPTPSQAA